MANGKLVIVVGPSGAGKDTLIDGAKRVLSTDIRFHFPRREITRPENAGGEAHLAVSVEEFHARTIANEYALSWQAHDTCYGISRSIDVHLAQGKTVVVNTSRTAIEPARTRYPGTTIIHISAPKELLAERLTARGRKSKTGVHARVARLRRFDALQRR
ncbi:MAG: phosphonate metabolism protein/1,5-bisphosphokinase (PRPP-forming) PhnN [Rhodospirillales bacterium]|nr:phosphonate metabolism protein/1,5-bisphosphokinase (PRPP-forming) PhnN [Rhodospirillales bacterium]